MLSQIGEYWSKCKAFKSEIVRILIKIEYKFYQIWRNKFKNVVIINVQIGNISIKLVVKTKKYLNIKNK